MLSFIPLYKHTYYKYQTNQIVDLTQSIKELVVLLILALLTRSRII